jgi:DNA-directed RNA polymerase subunit L
MVKESCKGGKSVLKIKILERTAEKLKLEIEGEGHTFSNLLESVLLEDNNVEFTSYDIPHPLLTHTIILIKKKKGKKPETLLTKAVRKIVKQGKEFNDLWNNYFKNKKSTI